MNMLLEVNGQGLITHDPEGTHDLCTLPTGSIEGKLILYTIYHRPLDLPHFPYVVRLFVEDKSTRFAYPADTLEEARRPPRALGFTKLEREPGDEPQIVEVWV